mgnify:CR=1 FL=1
MINLHDVMKKLLSVLLLTSLFFSCKEKNEDIVTEPNKEGSIETVVSVKHEEGFDILTTTHKVWVKNQLDKNFQPLELGFDKWTNNLYANKEFMLNCVNYLLDDNGLINIRSKDVTLPLLDKQSVQDNYSQTQMLTVALPIVLLGIFGVLFTYLR